MRYSDALKQIDCLIEANPLKEVPHLPIMPFLGICNDFLADVGLEYCTIELIDRGMIDRITNSCVPDEGWDLDNPEHRQKLSFYAKLDASEGKFLLWVEDCDEDKQHIGDLEDILSTVRTRWLDHDDFDDTDTNIGV